MSEAVPLAHALVARLAELEGVRILFIKGPTAVALGARPPRPVDRRRRAVRARWPREARPGLGALRLAATGAEEQRARSSSTRRSTSSSTRSTTSTTSGPATSTSTSTSLASSHPTTWSSRSCGGGAPRWRSRTGPCPAQTSSARRRSSRLHASARPAVRTHGTDVDSVEESLRSQGPSNRGRLRRTGRSDGQLARPCGHCSDDLRAPLRSHSPWSDPELLRRWQVRTQHAERLHDLLAHRAAPHAPGDQAGLIRRALFLPADEFVSALTSACLALTEIRHYRLRIERLVRGEPHALRGRARSAAALPRRRGERGRRAHVVEDPSTCLY